MTRQQGKVVRCQAQVVGIAISRARKVDRARAPD